MHLQIKQHSMKKRVFTLLIALLSLSLTSQNAVNFSIPDCDGVNYDLFSELNAGKVIVICWVMPCASCTNPMKAAYAKVQSFKTTHPGKVEMLVVDDYANTSCANLVSYAQSHSVTDVKYFSNAAIRMLDYGTNGMPKIVVIAGYDGQVLYNVDNMINVIAFENAINSGLILAGVEDNSIQATSTRLAPNPAGDFTTLSINITDAQNIDIAVYTAHGKRVIEGFSGSLTAGQHNLPLNTSTLGSGLYFVVVRTQNAISYLPLLK